jgi:hypothetical protein
VTRLPAEQPAVPSTSRSFARQHVGFVRDRRRRTEQPWRPGRAPRRRRAPPGLKVTFPDEVLRADPAPPLTPPEEPARDERHRGLVTNQFQPGGRPSQSAARQTPSCTIHANGRHCPRPHAGATTTQEERRQHQDEEAMVGARPGARPAEEVRCDYPAEDRVADGWAGARGCGGGRARSEAVGRGRPGGDEQDDDERHAEGLGQPFPAREVGPATNQPRSPGTRRLVASFRSASAGPRV